MIYYSPYVLLNPLIILRFPLLFVNSVYWVNKLNCPPFLLILIVLCPLILFTMICGYPLFLVLLAISTMFSFLTIIQIFCRHFLLVGNRKSDIFVNFRTFILPQFGLPIKTFQCDHGGEFDNGSFHNFCAQHGISLRFSCPETSSQNGNLNAKFALLVMSFALFSAMPLFLLLFGLTPWKLLHIFSTFFPLNS